MNAPSIERQLFDQLMASQYLEPNVLAQRQQARLSELLRFAARELPFYADRLAPVLRAGTIDLTGWSQVPVLRREEVLANIDALRPARLPSPHGRSHEFKTSGSTGEPVRVLVSQLANAVNRASGWRAQTWHDLDWSSDVLTWMGDSGIDGEPGVHRRGPWGPPWRADAKGQILSVARQTPPDQVLEVARSYGVGYLMGRPRSLQELANAARRLDVNLPLKGLMTFGTATTDDERADCRSAFGASMLGGYASKEAGLIAHDCPVCGQMHVNADTVLLEILDECDRPVPHGSLGRIVVTPLYNFAQPLIRYEQGDMGALGTRTSCGRSLPVLRQIAGRTTDLFRFPDGQVVAPSIPVEPGQLMGAAAWQLVQIGPLALEVRYIPKAGVPRNEAVFESAIHRLIRSDVSVSFRVVESLSEGPGGKYRQYLSLLGGQPGQDANPDRVLSKT